MRTITVTVNKVFHPREPFSDGNPHWCVLMTSAGKCTGMLSFYPASGTRLRLTGSEAVWHGTRQFKFVSVEHDAPEDRRALLTYAASLSKGVGPKAVEQIWSEFGEGWLNRVAELPPKWSMPLQRTLNELMSNRDRMAAVNYLLHLGFGPKIGEAAYAKWGKATVPTVQNDPYLMTNIKGVGFKTVDEKFREKLGSDSPRRAVAAVDYALRSMMEESGSSITRREGLYRQLDELGVPKLAASRAIGNLVESGRVVFCGLDEVATSDRVKCESDIARYIARSNPGRAAARFPDGFVPDESQVAAAEAAVGSIGLTIVNGGAGVGKTVSIAAIAQTLKDKGDEVCLCTFAGKAAARLREATGMQATTIHSLLRYTGEGGGFALGNLHGRTVIVDEASMVPSSLLYEITRRDPERLILVGDQAQLQPVGIGSPFHDLVDSLSTVVHTLGRCYRNREAVFAAAAKIRNGEIPADANSAGERFSVVHCASPLAAHNTIVDAVRDGLVDFEQDLVLSPRNGEGSEPQMATVAALNESIQAIVNPHENGERFKPGDRVMCVKNWAEKDIWNGTTGWVRMVDTDGRPYFESDSGGGATVPKEMFQFFVPAYCMTVHKAQGSQYRNVYCVCLKRDEARLFDRSMLYTAVTRARKECTIICDDGLSGIVNSVRRRQTYLQRLLNGDI